MKIAITGATGLIGKKIVSKLVERKDEVIILTTSVQRAKSVFKNNYKFIDWSNDFNQWYSQLENVDVVLNLAGENVIARRWNEEHKNKIYKSRIDNTKKLVSAISLLNNKLKLFISASAIGYYGNINSEVDETSNAGSDFLAQVVKDWENASLKLEDENIRRVIFRIGIVLDKNGGALPKLILPFKFFVGGSIGSGKQWFSWIHVDDLVNMFLFAIDNNINGVFNATSPNPVKMKEFSKTIGKILNRPSFLDVPSFIIKLALGEGAETILNGAKVKCEKILNEGFKFQYEKLDDALKSLLKK
ncbi:MAG: TIGR01777 family oxidoreductase [Melioribacteraceae bacterium]|nr:TIGR01777 family oxidoreductase [Melioribacteraceae bacterium]